MTSCGAGQSDDHLGSHRRPRVGDGDGEGEEGDLATGCAT